MAKKKKASKVKAASKPSNAKYEAEKRKLLSAKTPAQYIQRSLDSKLSRGEKGTITRDWLEKTRYTHEDILHARNRNNYWKKQKGKGSYERTLKRLKKLNFAKKGGERRVWNEKDLGKFYDINNDNADWQLAKKFNISLPAVNHVRRKFKLAKAILEKTRKPVSKSGVIKLAMTDEKGLRRRLEGK